VRLAVALDQPAAQRYFERQVRVRFAGRRSSQASGRQRLFFVPAEV